MKNPYSPSSNKNSAPQLRQAGFLFMTSPTEVSNADGPRRHQAALVSVPQPVERVARALARQRGAAGRLTRFLKQAVALLVARGHVLRHVVGPLPAPQRTSRQGNCARRGAV